MIRGKELEEQTYQPNHIEKVLADIEDNFPRYFAGFVEKQPRLLFDTAFRSYFSEQDRYRDYLDLEALQEYENDPGAFKAHSKGKCPIIRRCLQSRDEAMKSYRRAFNSTSGRDMLNPVRKLSEFGKAYAANFNDDSHESAETYTSLGLDVLNQGEYGCVGVIGYGIQSSMLYGLYPREFAHRSQMAIWSLYFLSGRKDFGLRDASEFLMVHPDEGTCEQNYFYPADLFGFYALKLSLMLKDAMSSVGVRFEPSRRYIYLSAFCDHVGEVHRNDIQTFKRNSQDVEGQPWF